MYRGRNVTSEQSRKMGIAIKTLRQRGIQFDKKTEHQIKVDEWNFYPTSGAIYRDGDPRKMPQRGLDEFIKLVGSKDSEKRIDDTASDDHSPPAGVDFRGISIVPFPSLD